MFNLSFIQKLKKKFFPFYKNSQIRFVFKKLQEDFPAQKTTAMFVGGCVRKYLSNEDIDDIDIATSLTTDQIKDRFKNTNFSVVDSGIKHGTITLVLDKLKLELTTLRKDIRTDGRHAEVEYTDNWREDSARRDFTINAIYLNISGEIFDPQLGVQDLKERKIKFIGDPQQRIEEDYLRIIRFVRFSLQYESEIEDTTVTAIKLNLNGIKKISKERILSELFKILKIKEFVKLNNNKSLKEIFSLIFPEFKYYEGLNKIDKIFYESKLNTSILLGILLIDEANNHEYFSHKYNISNDLNDSLNLLAKNFINIRDNKNFLKKDLKKNAYYFGKEHLKELNIIFYSNNKDVKFKDYLISLRNIQKLSIPKFPIDGKYLKNKGMKEGLIIGKVLKLIEVEWINNDFKISDEKILKIISRHNN